MHTWYEISFTNDTLAGVGCFKCQFFFHSFVHQQNDSYKVLKLMVMNLRSNKAYMSTSWFDQQ
jgi:hypothetical protein